MSRAHLTNVRCVGALAQSHASSICARTLATASGSSHDTTGRIVDVVAAAPGRTTTIPAMPRNWCGMQ
jgi:hypothetical protein